MEHFHNPSSHVARSIMPVFPFDDSKFYALTHMLNAIGILNRNQVREIWEKRDLAHRKHIKFIVLSAMEITNKEMDLSPIGYIPSQKI